MKVTVCDLEPQREKVLRRLSKHSMPITETGCIAWLSGVTENGYSLFTVSVNGQLKTTMGHRVAYMLAFGDIPDGLELDHKCGVRCCINPLHLEPVTHLVNRQRSAARHRISKAYAAYMKAVAYETGAWQQGVPA